MHKCHCQWMINKNHATKHEFKKARNTYQSQLWQMKQTWWQKKAQELQDVADRCDSKSFYQNLKGVFGPVSGGSTPILSIEGNLLTDEMEITKCWAEPFSNVLNMDSIVDVELISNLPQRPVSCSNKG
uniref:Uncharacterized protein n=1 Tax=Octopus bimaculoides TaxID=37653 RepID=A0A0L8H5T8_OCTBM